MNPAKQSIEEYYTEDHGDFLFSTWFNTEIFCFKGI